MELTFVQLNELFEALTALKNKTMPFKLSLIIAKDLALIDTEMNFYIDREREFADRYLQKDESGKFIQEPEGVFKIIDGLEDDCRAARKELDAFTTTVELRRIPVSLLENLEITPADVAALEPVLEEEVEE